VIDAGQRIIFFNSGAEQIFEHTEAEMQGKPLTVLLPARFRDIHPGHVKGFAASTDPPRRMGLRRQVVGLRKSGQEFEMEASITRLQAGSPGLNMVVVRDTSDRHDVEQVIRVMAEGSQETVCIFDQNDHFLYLNPAFQNLLGYSLEDLTGKYSMADIIHPDDRDHPRLASISGSHELRVRHKDGHWVWFEGARYPIELWSRSVIVAIGRDITARKQAEAEAESLLRSARRQASLMDKLMETFADPILIVDKHWQYSYANAAACRYMALSRADIIGHTPWELSPGFKGTNFEAAWRRGMEATAPTSYEEHYAPSDRWFSVHFFPTDDGMAVHFVDITAHRHAQAAQSGLATILSHARDALGPETLEALNIMPDPMAVMDEQLRYAYLNEAAKKVASLPEAEMLGRTPWEVDASLLPFKRNYREALKTQHRSSFQLYYDPADRWFAVELIPTGKYVIAYTVDISLQKKSEEAVQYLTDTLEQALDGGWDRKAGRNPKQSAHTHKRK
jgi:PAS domain S-box-containing protein